VVTSAGAQEIEVLSTEDGLPVTLLGAQTARGLTPFSLSNGGDYTLIRAGGRGFEWRNARMVRGSQGRFQLVDDSRRRALLGSLLPGGGSMLSGRGLYGVTRFLGTGYLALQAIRAADDRDDRALQFQRWSNLYEQEADYAASEQYRWEMLVAHTLWEEDRDHAQRQALIAAGFFGLSAIESWWFNRPFSAQTRGSQLRLQVPRLSHGMTILASALMPGMGQAYRGEKRAAAYQAAWTLLVQEVHNTYHRKTQRDLLYSRRYSQYSEGGIDANENALLDDLRGKVRSAEDDLHLFASLAGGLWLANMMDVLFTDPAGNRPAGNPGGLALTPSPTGSMGLAWTARF